MKTIPRSRQVEQALKQVVKAIENSLTNLNQQAGRLMAKGKYDEATELADHGRSIQAFIGEIEGLQGRWRDLGKSGTTNKRMKRKGETTPLWSYYQPILQALESLGGVARCGDLGPVVEQLMAADLHAGDREVMANNRMRWQVMINRARKHIREEGWIEKDGSNWRITAAGRRAAKADAARKKN